LWAREHKTSLCLWHWTHRGRRPFGRVAAFFSGPNSKHRGLSREFERCVARIWNVCHCDHGVASCPGRGALSPLILGAPLIRPPVPSSIFLYDTEPEIYIGHEA